jgi:hypothetical protein
LHIAISVAFSGLKTYVTKISVVKTNYSGNIFDCRINE